ncbi:4Fe-4S dicluster domain-containing protein [Clostridium nigeriense]|uniref:4Fe-4S dicluster domain-containing protein n=1 Tax=Clostridium nigeriense TaxID=1805470 RepID=UPI000832927B|nr:4Fe-4S dicluster domain-containing protein [Clostridium nigeriense]
MSDVMKIMSFERILNLALEDYYTKGKIFGVEEKDFYRDIDNSIEMDFCGEYLRFPIGPAAGPHTQLTQNFLAAYLTGCRYFEPKTVQIVDGKEMQEMIARPCIDAKNVGYNVEWSTELTVEEAKEEYIKASILLQVMAIELGLSDSKDFILNISVGYDLKGIQSKKISDFIDDLKEAKDTKVFNECIEVLKKNINKFKKFKLEDIEKITSKITNIVTLSTMHGCKASEILDIATHLISDKKINTLLKCNSTLLGYDNVRKILDDLGYSDIELKREDFEHDLQFDMAKEIITKLLAVGKENNLTFGVKLTNTLPVVNTRNVMPGDAMYMSGKPLYPIAINVAKLIANEFKDIKISISGGIDKNNALDVFTTGIAPITIATLFLQPKGYANNNAVLNEMKKLGHAPEGLNIKALEELAEKAKNDANYKNKGNGRVLEDKLETFDCLKSCGICVDVCPNRANMKVAVEGLAANYQITHIENMCNECGNCHMFCPKGGFPYLKKTTIYQDLEEYQNSNNTGLLRVGEEKFLLREDGREYIYEVNSKEDKSKLEITVETILKDYPHYIDKVNVIKEEELKQYV